MPMSREQAQALTRCVHLLRPAWNEEGIYAALAKCRERDAYEVALAAIRAAQDDKAKTPGVIPQPGPHWNELAPTAPKRPRLSREARRARTCAECGRIDGCADACPGFTPLAEATRDRAGAKADPARAALKQTAAALCHGVPPTHCQHPEHRGERKSA